MGSAAADSGDRVERAVLALLLAFGGPAELSIEEIVDEIGNRPEVVRALARLEEVGLVGRVGASVRPTPAARRFDELDI
jgi:DNA-binding IclR family transcriptional regulator